MTAPTGAPEPLSPADDDADAAPPRPAPALATVPPPALAREAAAQTELAIAMLLRAGTLVSGLLLVAGLAAAALAGRALLPGGLAPAAVFRLEARLPELLAGAGLLALCATPIARVAVTAAAFARARERGPALVAAGVLALLLVGMALGGTHR